MSRPNISPIGNESSLILILSFIYAISSYVELSTLFSESRYTPGDSSLSSSINHCVFSDKKSLKSTPYSFKPCLSFLSLIPKSSLIKFGKTKYTENNVLVLTFDKYGVLREKKLYKKEEHLCPIAST